MASQEQAAASGPSADSSGVEAIKAQIKQIAAQESKAAESPIGEQKQQEQQEQQPETQQLSQETTPAEGQAQDAEKQPAEPEADRFSLGEKHREWAKKLGYGDGEIAAVKTQAEADAIERAGRKLSRLESKMGRDKQRWEAQQRPPEADELPPAKDQPVKGTSSPDDPAASPFTEDDWGEHAGRLNALHRLADLVPSLQKEIEGLKARTGQVDQILASRQEEIEKQVTSEADRFINALDGRTFDMFGKGMTDDLDDDSPEAQARYELLAEAGAIRQRHPEWSVSDSLERAMAVLHPDKHELAKRRKYEAQLQERSRQRTIPPGSQPAPTKASDPEKDVIEKVRQKAAELGIRM